MKILTVIGARPQFIKAAVVSRELRKKYTEVLVHTGQHYDYSMSQQFFEELDIPKPDYNLGISGGTHAQMTGRMMMAAEEVLVKERPDWLLVYGDTNSTLAAALAGAKLHIPICHVEAGVRTHSSTNPEEINRICTDHVSALLLACTQGSVDELAKEGKTDGVFLAGDPMFDAFLAYRNKITPDRMALTQIGGQAAELPKDFYYLTCHREENTNDRNLTEIFRAMEQLDAQVIYPVHPRNKERAVRIGKEMGTENILFTEPAGYLESLCLVNHAKKIITDSGGLQREAFFAEKQCITVLDFAVWPETMTGNRNQLSAPDAGEILAKMEKPQEIRADCLPFGDGASARKIVNYLEQYRSETLYRHEEAET